MANDISIVIADDQPIYRAGLRLIFQEHHYRIAGEAADGDSAISLTRKLKPTILLLDLNLPKKTGVEVLQHLSETPLTTRIVLLTTVMHEKEFVESMRLGARGVILRNIDTTLLTKAIRCIADGEFWVGRVNVHGLVHALQMAHLSAPESAAKKFSLTPRELEMVTAIMEGSSNKEIAKKFSISDQTVKHHLSSIFTKVGVSNRLELALFSTHHRLVHKQT